MSRLSKVIILHTYRHTYISTYRPIIHHHQKHYHVASWYVKVWNVAVLGGVCIACRFAIAVCVHRIFAAGVYFVLASNADDLLVVSILTIQNTP